MKISVSDYYDKNTRRFLRFSPSGSSATIHRAIWADGVSSRTEAVHYVHELLIRHAPQSPGRLVVWDLGCGVGASIEYLARRLQATFRGVTISPVQQDLATERLKRLSPPSIGRPVDETAGIVDARVALADFCDAEALASLRSDGDPTLIYMIESFGHSASADAVLGPVAAALRPGGRFVICDDLLSHHRDCRETLVRRFQHGWRIKTLLSTDTLVHAARTAGLQPIANLDLTPFVEKGRARDRLIRGVVAIADRTGFSRSRTAARPFWLNLFGGDALQRAHSCGLIEYRFLVFEKPP